MPLVIDPLERRARRHDVPHSGGHVSWRRFGDGPPLVLVHGGHGSWRHWARNIESLAERHELWLPDLPSYGTSSTPQPATLAGIVDATLGTLDDLVGAETPIGLAGFSFGGLVAAQLAVRRRSVAKLALLGPAGHGGRRRPRGELRSWREASERRDMEAMLDTMRHNLLVHMLHEPGAVDALALSIHTEACLRARFRSKPISRSANLGEVLARFDGAIQLVWGEHDVTAEPPEVANALVGGHGNRCFEIVPGAGHWVQYERPEVVNRILLDWFAAIPTVAT